jgi:hypothetical protein
MTIQRSRLSSFGTQLLAVAILALASLPADAKTLPIEPVTQESPVWCWVAVGEMVFDYFDIPNVNPAGDFQCGIIGLLAAGTWANACAYQCQLCQVPAGSAAGVIGMLRDYPRKVSYATAEEVTTLSASHKTRPLQPDEIKSEIDDGNPIIAGISPSGRPAGGSAAHVALIIGYRATEDSFELRVNDPYPFGGWQGNPYLAAGGETEESGSYWIPYESFRQALSWSESFSVSDQGSFQAPVGRSCCMSNGDECGPFLNQLPAPLRSACTCPFGNPYAVGRVCR